MIRNKLSNRENNRQTIQPKSRVSTSPAYAEEGMDEEVIYINNNEKSSRSSKQRRKVSYLNTLMNDSE